MARTSPRYVARLRNACEVVLTGSADLAFWKERLTRESLVCSDADGRAQVAIAAVEACYLGVRFTELSFSVRVSRSAYGGRQAGLFLAHAFNSCRFFALCERMLFSTPYEHAQASVALTPLPRVQLATQTGVAFAAEMRVDASAPQREPARSADEAFEGPIFLPTPSRTARAPRESPSAVFVPGIQLGPAHPGKLFFARLGGPTETYPFLAGVDALAIDPEGSPILAALVESTFRASEWIVRANGEHARSKTYPRSSAFAPPADR